MKHLNQKEWIAVIIGVVVVAGFFAITSGIFKSNNLIPMNQANVGSEGMSLSGDSQIATKGSLVSVNYVGRLSTGEEFDSSAQHGRPIQFVLGAGQVIQGWDEGIEGMRVGEKKTLTVPPEKGYGPNGYPPVIPPNATLIFDVELVSVQNLGADSQQGE